MLPAKVSLKFVAIFPPTTIVALDTFLILFLIRVTGVIAIAIIVTPIIASFQELYNKTPTSPISPKNVAINDFNISIIFLDAVSGSDKNLVSTIPEELTSKNCGSIDVNFLNKSFFSDIDIFCPVQSVK